MSSRNKVWDFDTWATFGEPTMEAHYLRLLAQRLEHLQKLENYHIRFSAVDITWATGAGVDGYREMRESIGQLVAEKARELREEVIARAQAAVAEARQQLENYQKEQAAIRNRGNGL